MRHDEIRTNVIYLTKIGAHRLPFRVDEIDEDYFDPKTRRFRVAYHCKNLATDRKVVLFSPRRFVRRIIVNLGY